MGKKYILVGVLLLLGRLAFAQDPQFTQWYAAPLYLNPAFAGSALAPRLTVNYRNQWPSITSYVTASAGFDHFMPSINSGVGLYVLNDSQGQGQIKSTEISAQYSYQLQLNENAHVRLGLQASYVKPQSKLFWANFWRSVYQSRFYRRSQ